MLTSSLKVLTTMIELKTTVRGVGILDLPFEAKRGSMTKAYGCWSRMLDRCYGSYKSSSYEDCEVSHGFKVFSTFKKWCETQKGFSEQGWELDKDLLGDSKLYSETTCCFIPQRINALITKKVKTKGLYPTGVSFYKRKNVFKADCMYKGVKKHLGYFDNVEDASFAYKFFKEAYVKELALEYKDVLDTHVFNALMKWKVTL